MFLKTSANFKTNYESLVANELMKSLCSVYSRDWHSLSSRQLNIIGLKWIGSVCLSWTNANDATSQIRHRMEAAICGGFVLAC
jgi:hypothetical protein